MDNDDDDNTIMMIASFVAQMLQTVDRFYIKDPQVLDITGEQWNDRRSWGMKLHATPLLCKCLFWLGLLSYYLAQNHQSHHCSDSVL